ncbi:MAG TPA: GNAT family N-acetyltransferase [Actinomycetota bacterium]|jgi:ribosomal protein S18 acetylase RimI-like enzyme|nr:GNAT family N-acetyltransferase [Actinomycetota bacterium]
MIVPAGLSARPLTLDDVDDTIAMVNTCELVDSGELMWERADLLSDISVDAFDADRHWLGVFDGDRIVAWAFLQGPRRLWIDVAPDVRGRGIGTALRRWAIARARERGNDRVGQTIEDGRADVATALRLAGFTPRHTSWILQMDHPTAPPPVPTPRGIEVRAIRMPDEEDQTLEMFETAFSEFADRLPAPLDDWRASVTQREGFLPDDLVVAVDGSRVVGGAFLIDSDEIWIDKLAVAATHRHRGIARALLGTAFLRSFERGYEHTSLSTDSRTGALILYERVGMNVTRSFTNWAIDL